MGKFGSLLISLGLVAAACSPSPLKTSASTTKIVDESLSQIDLLKKGAFAIAEYEYDSGALVDADVLNVHTQVKTDVRGRIFLPKGKGPFPLVVFLHGNHSTCGLSSGEGNPRLDLNVDFTTSGRCPAGYVEVPSYRGYDASARLLASWGYAVASINANRGITGRDGTDSFDSSLIYARGNLVLRHIEELFKWSRDGKSSLLHAEGLDLFNRLDISKVGLMGHSRGGEGVRYAYNIYKDSQGSGKWKVRIPGLQFQGIFEIGPVDVGTNSGLNKIEARGVAWNVLIPGCDRDVSDFSGVNPFERMELDGRDGFPKSVFTLWGANHNFFNSQWQVSDAPHECIGEQVPLWDVNAAAMPSDFQGLDEYARAGLTGSATQIKFEQALMLAFFHSHLGRGKELKWDHIFDPQYRLPHELSDLAPSSREYLLADHSKQVFDGTFAMSPVSLGKGLTVDNLKNHVQHQIALMNQALADFGRNFSGETYSAVLSNGSFIRSAAVIEGQGTHTMSPRTAYLPFEAPQSGRDLWTLDLALAMRKGCYSYNQDFQLECPKRKLDDTFDIALVLADGRVTSSVNIQDYVMLDNWYDNYFQYDGSQAMAGRTAIYFRYVPILYQTARFELSDFGITDETIKGIQITFHSGDDVSLILESMRLSRRP